MNIKKYRRSYDRNLQLLNDTEKYLGDKDLTKLNYHAGRAVGYIQGKLAVLETILDDEDPSIIDGAEDRVKAIQVLDAIDEARALHGTKPVLTHEELQALMPKAAPMQAVTEGFVPVAAKAPKIWQQEDPAKSGSYICRMNSAYIKMCYFTGSVWLDMWKDSLDGSVKEWMPIPYDAIVDHTEPGPGLQELLKMATAKGNPPPEAPQQTVITEGYEPMTAPTKAMPAKPPMRNLYDEFSPPPAPPRPAPRIVDANEDPIRTGPNRKRGFLRWLFGLD